MISREEVILNCFILFSLDHGKNIGHTRSNWRCHGEGYGYISKLDYIHDWFDDDIQDNFNRGELDKVKRLFK